MMSFRIWKNYFDLVGTRAYYSIPSRTFCSFTQILITNLLITFSSPQPPSKPLITKSNNKKYFQPSNSQNLCPKAAIKKNLQNP